LRNCQLFFNLLKKFETPGTFNWKVPPGVTSICIEVWGGGGAGGNDGSSYVSGGGGGGYGYECFTVIPGTTFPITVARGGAKPYNLNDSGYDGESSSFGILISASGGVKGLGGTSKYSAEDIVNGGLRGSSTNSYSIAGADGIAGRGWDGGAGGLGGAGGAGGVGGADGVIPGGGGRSGQDGDSGARGQVYIYW
jgi:hypothetical protein